MCANERPIQEGQNRAYALLAKTDRALEVGEIDEAEWYRQVAAVITPAYLAEKTPWAQSGKSGDEAAWTYARRLIADAFDRDGTFLDVGCSSGFLMECIRDWASERGHRVEPYGLDIAPELARRRLPHWRERIFVGNALGWKLPMRFDFVRTGLEYVPQRRQRDLVRHLLAGGGRARRKAYPGHAQ